MPNSISRRAYFRQTSVLLGGAALASVRLLAQSSDEKLAALRKQMAGPIHVVKVAPNVSMVTGAGGNIGVVTGPEGKIIIDSGVSNSTPEVLTAIRSIDAQPLKYLFNTHWHFDHTDGNEQFHAAGATIVAHEKTRERLATPQVIDLMKLSFPAMPAAALPTRTLTDAFTFFHGGEELTLQHVPPAHTDTDTYVYMKNANVLHTGDLFFNGAYPLIDYSSGGNINGYVDSTAKTIARIDSETKVIPGHGPLAAKAEFIAFHDLLATLRDRVGAAKQSGKTLEETIAAKPSAEFDGKWGKGMMSGDLFVTLVYKTL